MQPVVRITNLLTSAKVVNRSIESAATDCDSHRAKAKHRKVRNTGRIFLENFDVDWLAECQVAIHSRCCLYRNHEHSNVLSMTLSAWICSKSSKTLLRIHKTRWKTDAHLVEDARMKLIILNYYQMISPDNCKCQRFMISRPRLIYALSLPQSDFMKRILRCTV